MNRLIGSFFYVGYLPIAPGTWGSLAALPVVYAVFFTLGLWAVMALIALGFVLGWLASAGMIAQIGMSDPQEIVIDEVIGQWIAMLPVFILMVYAPAIFAKTTQSGRVFLLFLIPFASFRIFDITKPWIVRWADRLHSPLGVMLDDVVAGVFAWLPIILSLLIYAQMRS